MNFNSDINVQIIVHYLRDREGGELEYWSDGVLERELQTLIHYANTPVLQYASHV